MALLLTGYRCDAEIGSIRKGWHVCGRPASTHYTVRIPGTVLRSTLDYCRAHESHAEHVIDSRPAVTVMGPHGLLIGR